jgi:hypothetical protein
LCVFGAERKEGRGEKNWERVKNLEHVAS